MFGDRRQAGGAGEGVSGLVTRADFRSVGGRSAASSVGSTPASSATVACGLVPVRGAPSAERGASAVSIYLGNKNYSSWSLRPWLVLKQTGSRSTKLSSALRPTSKATIMKYSPSGTCRYYGMASSWFGTASQSANIWPSPSTFQLWPRDPDARAVARSVCAELHSGFRRCAAIFR